MSLCPQDPACLTPERPGRCARAGQGRAVFPLQCRPQEYASEWAGEGIPPAVSGRVEEFPQPLGFKRNMEPHGGIELSRAWMMGGGEGKGHVGRTGQGF